MAEETMQDWGEKAVLELVQNYGDRSVIGDDGAVINVPPGEQLVVTSDVFNEGVHFSDRTMEPWQVGWRLVAANISDLAAMGATPLGLTVSLSVPGATAIAWIRSLYEGMAAAVSHYHTRIIGGDLCGSSTKSIGMTALGRVKPQEKLERRRAQVGDVIFVSGPHGDSRAGLELLLHPQGNREITPGDRTYFYKAHQEPQARLEVVQRLQQIRRESPQFSHRLWGGMDSSDGLADSVLQICGCSGVGARLEVTQLPFSPALWRWPDRHQAQQWLLYGGEDFQLVLAVPRAIAERLQRDFPTGSIVGTITPATEGIQLVGADGTKTPLVDRSFRHFS